MKDYWKIILIGLGIIISLSNVYALCPPVFSGAVGVWKFDNDSSVGEDYNSPSSNDMVYDYSGNLNNGTTKNGLIYNSTGGIYKGAFEFDGSDDYVDIADGGSIPTANSNITVIGWVYEHTRDTSYIDVIVSKADSVDFEGWLFGIAGDAEGEQGKLFVFQQGYTDGWTGKSTGIVPLNTWTHVAFVFDDSGNTIDFYINGVSSGSVSEFDNILTATNNAMIGIDGRDLSNYEFDGNIDEIRIYNRSFTADEINKSFNAGYKRYYCVNCSDCENALNNECYDKIYLDNDINTGGLSCIDNPQNFSNKTFDCQGNMINGTGNNFGIYLNGKDNNIIRNCMVYNFEYGIYLNFSNNNSVNSNTGNDNIFYGIYLSSFSNNNSLLNNILNNNAIGIYLESSLNNTLNNNTVMVIVKLVYI